MCSMIRKKLSLNGRKLRGELKLKLVIFFVLSQIILDVMIATGYLRI